MRFHPDARRLHTAVSAWGDEPLDWRYKGLPSRWWGRTPAAVCADRVRPFDEDAVGPLCVLDAAALDHNLTTMARWCRDHGVELAPHGKTHMAPQLLARQFDAGACAVTVATISQVRTFRAFGVEGFVLANELVDDAGLRWLASELDANPNVDLVCWVDSVRGVESMTATLADAGATRPVEVCVEVGMAGGRTGCRSADDVDAVARAAAASERLRLVGVAGYEAATADPPETVRAYLGQMRAAVVRLAGLVESDEILVTAGGSSYFDLVVEELTGWPADLAVRTVLRSGCYLTHDDGLYGRSSPLAGPGGLRAALSVWAQVVSRPEPGLALLTMGRRDVSFDAGLPVPYGLSDAEVTALNDQHAYLRVGPADRERVDVGSWLRFGVSHPCTTFDKWQVIPLLDDDGRVVDLVRTFF
ncbi:alanine racemase [Mycolicibacterium madagascariense]|nr:alanine racemase [Mycolicibacterium madagascariense]MCV7010907.1 alanine racemase [Mycolicibacterium madagascariense]